MTVVDLAAYRRRKEERWLEREILEWTDPDAQDLLVITLDAIRRQEDAGGLWTLASAYRIHCPEDPAGTLAAGASQVLLGEDRGFDLLHDAIAMADDNPFYVRFAAYAIGASPFPPEVRSGELVELRNI